jgi:hypothetical protein
VAPKMRERAPRGPQGTYPCGYPLSSACVSRAALPARSRSPTTRSHRASRRSVSLTCAPTAPPPIEPVSGGSKCGGRRPCRLLHARRGLSSAAPTRCPDPITGPTTGKRPVHCASAGALGPWGVRVRGRGAILERESVGAVPPDGWICVRPYRALGNHGPNHKSYPIGWFSPEFARVRSLQMRPSKGVVMDSRVMHHPHGGGQTR